MASNVYIGATEHLTLLKGDDIIGFTFTVTNADTTAYDLVTSLFDNATIKQFKTAEEAAQALVNGEVHAYVASSPQPELLALEHPDTLDLPLDKPLVTYKAGLAVKKGEQEWLNFLNAWVTARSADKWLSATHDYWFESLEWRSASN
jgi:polar amino acid transport system substrate-binding protein